jgi:hypothetical protein
MQPEHVSLWLRPDTASKDSRPSSSPFIHPRSAWKECLRRSPILGPSDRGEVLTLHSTVAKKRAGI